MQEMRMELFVGLIRFGWFGCLFLVVLEIVPLTLHVLDKHLTTNLYPQPSLYFLF